MNRIEAYRSSIAQDKKRYGEIEEFIDSDVRHETDSNFRILEALGRSIEQDEGILKELEFNRALGRLVIGFALAMILIVWKFA